MTQPSLWSELKRRHVVKVFLVYAVAAAAVVEAADLMSRSSRSPTGPLRSWSRSP